MDSEHLMAFCTCPDATVAGEIAETVIADGHAACANIVPGLTSVYAWKGEVHRDAETLLIMKSTRAAWRRLEETILRLHPDEVPEIIAVPVTHGLNDYLAWVTYQTDDGNRN